MKIAVAGKGGVGKTTVAGTLARLLGQDGLSILAVDADPSYTLWSAIGIPAEQAEKILPLTENEELLKERMEISGAGSYKEVFKLNPRVDDLSEMYAVEGPDNVSLLVAGTVEPAAIGIVAGPARRLASPVAPGPLPAAYPHRAARPAPIPGDRAAQLRR